MAEELTENGTAGARMVTVVVSAPDDLPGYRAFFEPEGGERDMTPGDRLTITMTGTGPMVIEVYAYDGGLVLWRPPDIPFDNILVADKDGNRIDDIY